jgi:6-pyruvoyltetrahydropterin 2'-reductase
MSNNVLSLSDDHVFYTVEGEGKYIGWPSVFMRMAMCNLTCQGFASPDSPHGCDSFVSWSVKNRYTFDELNNYYENNGFDKELKRGAILKITGGEPLLQQKRLLEWLETFVERFGFKPRIDFESNSTLKPKDEWYDIYNATFTLSPKMSNNGDPENRRYKPDVIAHHNERGECFKFVINSEEDEKELFEKYIDNGIVNPDNVWLMPCAGSRDEHTAKSAMVAELCKKHNFKFSPRLQLVIWDMALKV